jgi:hypothetical protein
VGGASSIAVVATNYVMAAWIGAGKVQITTNWTTAGLASSLSVGSGACHVWDSCIGLGRDTNVYFLRHNQTLAGAGVLAAINQTGAPRVTSIAGMPFNPGLGCAVEYMPTNLFSDQHARLFVLRGGTNSTDGVDGSNWTMATGTNQLAVYDLAAQTWSLQTLPFSVDGGSEMCLVGDTLYFLSTNSDTAPLKIMKFVDVVPPVITQSPTNLTVCASQSATFSVTATGSPLTYQWRFFTTNILAGATNDSYTVANALVTNAGNYDVVVASPGGSVTSAVAVLTVWVEPVISPNPASRTNVGGTTATFISGATGTPTPALTWLKNFVPLSNAGNISGATTGTLIVSNVHPADAGNYQLVATSAAGGATSLVAVLTFQLPARPKMTIQPQGSASGVVMSWSDPDGVFSLYTSTNVVGPYSAVGGVTSSYTNPVSEAVRFFQLKWE